MHTHVLQALQMVSAVQLRSRQGAMQEVHAGQTGDGRRPAAGSVSAHIDTTAQQQVAALGALVAVLLQLQVRHGARSQGAWTAVAAQDSC
jgi:hypothetical protein